MTLPTVQADVISDLAGVQPGSPLAGLRAQRPEAMTHAQGSYDAWANRLMLTLGEPHYADV